MSHHRLRPERPPPRSRGRPARLWLSIQYAKKDWHQRLGSGVHADAIMDRIVHHTIWIETGGTNMREHAAVNAA